MSILGDVADMQQCTAVSTKLEGLADLPEQEQWKVVGEICASACYTTIISILTKIIDQNCDLDLKDINSIKPMAKAMGKGDMVKDLPDIPDGWCFPDFSDLTERATAAGSDPEVYLKKQQDGCSAIKARQACSGSALYVSPSSTPLYIVQWWGNQRRCVLGRRYARAAQQ